MKTTITTLRDLQTAYSQEGDRVVYSPTRILVIRDDFAQLWELTDPDAKIVLGGEYYGNLVQDLIEEAYEVAPTLTMHGVPTIPDGVPDDQVWSILWRLKQLNEIWKDAEVPVGPGNFRVGRPTSPLRLDAAASAAEHGMPSVLSSEELIQLSTEHGIATQDRYWAHRSSNDMLVYYMLPLRPFTLHHVGTVYGVPKDVSTPDLLRDLLHSLYDSKTEM